MQEYNNFKLQNPNPKINYHLTIGKDINSNILEMVYGTIEDVVRIKIEKKIYIK